MMANTPRLIGCFLAAGLALRILVIQWTAGIELILDEVNVEALDYVDGRTESCPTPLGPPSTPR